MALAEASESVSEKPSRYAVSKLTLQSFRNYDFASLDVGQDSVVLTGHNGAGKTNILEALSLLIPGRGIRSATVGELDNVKLSMPWVVSADVTSGEDELHIGTGRDASAPTEKRLVKIDGDALSSQNHLARYMSVVWLTPQMDSLFRDSAGMRRRFIDRLAYSFDAEHASHVNAYERTMRERNKLLSQHGFDARWANVLEQQLAGYGVAIAMGRNQLIARLNHMIDAGEHPFPKAELALQGEVEAELAGGLSASEAEEHYAAKLSAGRREDSYAGRTLYGVHKSDLQTIHRDKQMEASLCSTGEQKAMLLSIVLAHAHARAEWEGCAPIILLDEVVAHLDSARREALFDALDALGVQVWMTGTDAADFSAIKSGVRQVDVQEGRLITL